MKLPKILFIFLIIAITCFSYFSFAYDESHPPYKFKDGPFPSLDKEPLVSLFGKREYISEDKDVVVKFDDKGDSLFFLVKQGDYILAKKEKKEEPYPDAVYRADIDKNGLKDFIIFYTHRGCGLAVVVMRTEIFLKKKGGGYQKISYDTFYSNIEDFVDLDGNGKYELIITDLYYGKKHNYWAYNIYKFKDYKLVNANSEYKNFPKIVWFTESPNDKDTTHLSLAERKEAVTQIDKLIKNEKK